MQDYYIYGSKKSDITDLTDLTFSVNTISAKGTPDKIDCDYREEGGFYIITAILKGTIFEASGKAVFNLCGQKFDSSHIAIKSWGSEDITALVGSHSHSEKAIEERLAETESNVTELQMALCDIYEGMSNNG